MKGRAGPRLPTVVGQQAGARFAGEWLFLDRPLLGDIDAFVAISNGTYRFGPVSRSSRNRCRWSKRRREPTQTAAALPRPVPAEMRKRIII